MNKLSQQKHLDWAEHGMNCADDHCVLPVCINWKAFRQAIARQNGRQTQDVETRSKDAKQPRSGPVRGHNNDQRFLQFQREVQEFERVQLNISEYLAGNKPTVNPLQVYPEVDKVESQQVPQVTSYGPMQDKEKPTIPNFDLEQFISIDSYVVPPEKKEDMKSKCTQNDHVDIPIELPLGRSAFSLEESKEQLQGIQAKGTNKIFGILSEILHVLEAPMSAELEAFCIQALQKALEDIQTTSRSMSSPSICTWETSELDIFFCQWHLTKHFTYIQETIMAMIKIIVNYSMSQRWMRGKNWNPIQERME